MSYADRVLSDLAGGRTLPWMWAGADLERMLTVTPEACEVNPGFHAAYGSGAVRFFVHQHCAGCDSHKRFWACDGCIAVTRKWIAQGAHSHHSRCGHSALLADFVVSIEATR